MIFIKKLLPCYQKMIFPKTNIEARYLPSSSAANATYSLNQLVKEYSIIKNINA